MMSEFKIVKSVRDIDLPIYFTAPVVETDLPKGLITIEGLESQVEIRIYDLSELVNVLLASEFEGTVAEMAKKEWAMIMFQGTWRSIAEKENGSKAPAPSLVLSKILSLSLKYQIPIVPLGDLDLEHELKKVWVSNLDGNSISQTHPLFKRPPCPGLVDFSVKQEGRDYTIQGLSEYFRCHVLSGQICSRMRGQQKSLEEHLTAALGKFQYRGSTYEDVPNAENWRFINECKDLSGRLKFIFESVENGHSHLGAAMALKKLYDKFLDQFPWFKPLP